VNNCAEQRRPLFERPELHKCLIDIWKGLPSRFPGVALDEFVIIPDHVHFIIWLDSTKEKALALDRVVGAYKSLTTVAWLSYNKASGIVCSKQLWQRRYYDPSISDYK